MALKLRFGILCDYATVGANGKAIAVHIFENLRLRASQTGMMLTPFYLVAQIECRIADGSRHAIDLQLIDEDGRELAVWPFPEVEYRSQGAGLPLVARYMMQIGNMPAPGPGTYEFAFREKGGAEAGRVSFHVVPADTLVDS